MLQFETNGASVKKSINDNGNWLSEEGCYTFLIMSKLRLRKISSKYSTYFLT
jgi:hypothetical protein